MIIREAKLSDIDALTPLFDAYIVFYRKPSDPESCKSFLMDRLTRKEAIVFIAQDEEGRGAGFTLLYPTFSSVRKAKIFILNDLYVHPEFRRKGLGARLLEHAVEYGRRMGAAGLHLETELSNTKAQALYEREGWEKEIDEFHYNYTL